MQYDNLPGRSAKNAKKALALAEERGFDPTEVRTYRDGYYVPISDEEAAKAAEEAEAAEDKSTESKSTDEKKPATKTTRKRASTKKE